jgi:hypothetical protein
MIDPATTLTTNAIATLAFQEFIKSGAGEWAKKFTAEAMLTPPTDKMGQLRELLWHRLREKYFDFKDFAFMSI